MMHRRIAALVLAFLSVLAVAQQPPSALSWAEGVDNQYLVYPDRQYVFAGGVSLKLDVWQAQTRETVPTVVYFHGGGWFFGDRTGTVPYMLPWMVRGWNVVNVEYRMSGTALAPAAVEDARCALRWVFRNSKEFHLDTSRIVVTGHSAGGHLALMTGMLQESDGFDNNCPAEPAFDEKPLKVSAVIDWYGPTDVPDLLTGTNRRNWAVQWLGRQSNLNEVSEAVSPIKYVRPGLPPILIIHGDQDPVVPFEHSQKLHRLLDSAHSINEFYVVAGGKHGQFGVEADRQAYSHVWEFLEKHLPGIANSKLYPHAK